MLTYEYIKEAQDFLVDYWGEDGKKVIVEAFSIPKYNKPFSEFLNECSTCGGNWGGMLLTGVKRLWPNVYDAIPEQMGHFAWNAILYTLLLCGVDTTSE